jgi:hypothetical protein
MYVEEQCAEVMLTGCMPHTGVVFCIVPLCLPAEYCAYAVSCCVHAHPLTNACLHSVVRAGMVLVECCISRTYCRSLCAVSFSEAHTHAAVGFSGEHSPAVGDVRPCVPFAHCCPQAACYCTRSCSSTVHVLIIVSHMSWSHL